MLIRFGANWTECALLIGTNLNSGLFHRWSVRLSMDEFSGAGRTTVGLPSRGPVLLAHVCVGLGRSAIAAEYMRWSHHITVTRLSFRRSLCRVPIS